MNIVRIWPVKRRLGGMLRYVADGKKTAGRSGEEEIRDGSLCWGINCAASTALDQFMTVKLRYGKTDGILAYHGFLSLGQPGIAPEKMQKIGEEFVRRMWGGRFQAVVATHTDTEHIHTHFLVNSVSFRDGRRMQQGRFYTELGRTAYEVCREYGLEAEARREMLSSPPGLEMKDKLGLPTKFNVARDVLDRAAAVCRNEAELRRFLSREGCSLFFSPENGCWKMTVAGDKKPIRLFRLGENYTHARLAERLAENMRDDNFVPAAFKKPGQRQYRLPVREDRIKNTKEGLYGLFLRYCCRLGALPGYKKPELADVHCMLRADLMKLDEIREVTAFLGRRRICTDGQLEACGREIRSGMEALVSKRAELHREIRRKSTPAERLPGAREQIAKINRRLAALRKEAKLCASVPERARKTEERLRSAETEKEMEYERRR